MPEPDGPVRMTHSPAATARFAGANPGRLRPSKTSMTNSQPLRLHRAVVRPEWVDYNNHLNVAYYVLIFDHATDAALDHLDIGTDYREATSRSVFVAEAHVTYEKEVTEGEAVGVATRLLGFDGKRIVLFHEMTRERDGVLVATNEVLCLHVDLSTRRTAPWASATRRCSRARTPSPR